VTYNIAVTQKMLTQNLKLHCGVEQQRPGNPENGAYAVDLMGKVLVALVNVQSPQP